VNLSEKYRSDNDFFTGNKNVGLRFLNRPVLIKVYLYKNESTNVNLEHLNKLKAFPSFVISDYYLLKGEYKIIGNAALEPDEYDFPVSCGIFSRNTSEPYLNTSFFQWGYIYKTKKSFSWYKNSLFRRFENATDVTYFEIHSYL